MDSEKFSKVLNYIADSAETGYSAVFTFAVKELCDQKERTELVQFLRNQATSQANPLRIRQ